MTYPAQQQRIKGSVGLGLQKHDERSAPRILYVITLPIMGGAQSHLIELFGRLSPHYKISIAVESEGFLTERLAEMGIETHILPKIRWLIDPLAVIRAIRALSKLMKQISPDIVHAHSSKAGMLTRIAARLSGTRSIYSTHGWSFNVGATRHQRALAWPADSDRRALVASLGFAAIPGLSLAVGGAKKANAQQYDGPAPAFNRSIDLRKPGVITVTDYGEGDDDAMFSAALSDIETLYNETQRKVAVLLPPGNYSMRRSIDLRVPVQLRADGAYIDQGVRVLATGCAITGLTVRGAPNFGIQLFRGQGAIYRDLTLEYCGGAGLLIGGIAGSQVAWSHFEGLRLLNNAGGLAISAGEAGLPIANLDSSDYSPSIILSSRGGGYPSGRTIQLLFSQEKGRGGMVLVETNNGSITRLDLVHGGDGYRIGETLSIGNGGGTVTVQAIQNDGKRRRKNWCNANTFTGLWVRDNSRFGLVAHGGVAYNSFYGLQAEGNNTYDMATLDGEWALTKFFGGHIVGGNQSEIGRKVPTVRVRPPGRGNQWYGVRFVQQKYAGSPRDVVDLPKSDIVTNPEFVSARGAQRGW